ncbi:Legume-like lectin family [Leishmania donovani]|uniref:Legume-like_lectin_family_putative/Pfam:PF03388 n=1 Tax=Leishmania donovani TaxID=5661 RepID=A0A6J8F3Q2_LEIDO|nr:Legume-like lectin family [Leishmania donovani]VDZ41980.1 Legume-like_lectin_family_putative/Pfam:PF03388 [Leishmania donovani]
MATANRVTTIPMATTRLAVSLLTLFLCGCACVSNAAAARVNDDLPPGVMRGPLLHEHSFQEPLVSDWWEEGVPHYMIGGSAVANERFLRLTTNDLDDHGFAFNTAPLDHDNWEARVRFSIRPPPLAADMNGSSHYQGGDGMALWYLDQPIGDDHQHVVKYSKSISPELRDEMLDAENPWRVADFLLNGDDDDDEDEGVDEDDLTEQEKQERQQAKDRRATKKRKREALFKRLFKRGTSVDESDREPRIMGVKFSDFNKGFGLILDSVGDEKEHLREHQQQGDAVQHHHHTSSIYLLLNLPNHTSSSGATVVNNFDPTRENFRSSPHVLRCTYDFRQKGTKPYDPKARMMDKVTKAATAAEEPLELIVRYYKQKLTVIIRREDVAKREVSWVVDEMGKATDEVEVVRTHTETMCGEVYPIHLPLRYHFGLSASTGHRPAKNRKRRPLRSVFHEADKKTFTHVDVHDVLKFDLRELGLDAKAMGYSKTIPLEHFDFEADRRERLHFSRQLPVNPDSDTA